MKSQAIRNLLRYIHNEIGEKPTLIRRLKLTIPPKNILQYTIDDHIVTITISPQQK